MRHPVEVQRPQVVLARSQHDLARVQPGLGVLAEHWLDAFLHVAGAREQLQVLLIREHPELGQLDYLSAKTGCGCDPLRGRRVGEGFAAAVAVAHESDADALADELDPCLHSH
ncbi:hypothetical protein D3C78_911520 [compost metagenome]